MADHVALAALAERLIAANGRTITLRRIDRTANNPAKPWRGPPSPGSPVTISVVGVFVDDRIDRDAAGDLVRRPGQSFLVSAKAASPQELEKFDSVDDGGQTWKLTAVRLLKPGSTSILYSLEVER